MIDINSEVPINVHCLSHTDKQARLRFLDNYISVLEPSIDVLYNQASIADLGQGLGHNLVKYRDALRHLRSLKSEYKILQSYLKR